MSHVNQQVGAAKIRNLSHALVVDQAAIGRSTSNDDFGSVHDGIVFQGFVVNEAGIQVYPVREGFEVCRDC